MGGDDNYIVKVLGEKVVLPSPNLHALFLLKHMMAHFAAQGINLRQLLDWFFFVKIYKAEVDWIWLESILKQYGMLEMYNILNAICVDQFGFDSQQFSCIQYNPTLKDKVLNDIINQNLELNCLKA